jgi:hypothetical protein
MTMVDPYDKPVEILLTDGDWTIEALENIAPSKGFKSHRSTYYSLVKHVCYPGGRLDGVPANSVHQVVVYPDDTSFCWRCNAEIPEGMVAVWKFQNWEQLQYGS